MSVEASDCMLLLGSMREFYPDSTMLHGKRTCIVDLKDFGLMEDYLERLSKAAGVEISSRVVGLIDTSGSIQLSRVGRSYVVEGEVPVTLWVDRTRRIEKAEIKPPEGCMLTQAHIHRMGPGGSVHIHFRCVGGSVDEVVDRTARLVRDIRAALNRLYGPRRP